jgi:predicted nucleotidyltransferase
MQKKHKEKIIQIIKKHIPVCTIYLFGSRSRKSHAEGSDVDLAISAPKKIDRHIISKIKQEVENANIPLFVDIVDLKQIDENLMSEIKKDGVLWHS